VAVAVVAFQEQTKEVVGMVVRAGVVVEKMQL
jgi:hypothetical protein